jgi:membrane protease YdiL (CAAX protease family)
MEKKPLPNIKSFAFFSIIFFSFTIIFLIFNYLISSPIGYTEIMFLISILFYIFIIFLNKPNFLDKKLIGLFYGKSLYKTIVLGILFGIIPFIISTIFFPIIKDTTNLYSFFTTVFLSPIWEEFYFRALLFTFFNIIFITFINFLPYSKKGYKINYYLFISLSILITSTIFTNFHTNLPAGVLIGSIFFTFIFFYTKSILCCTISHSIFNILIFITRLI